MGLLDNYNYTPGLLAGIGAPARPSDFHQLAISDLIEYINGHLANTTLRALPEQKLEKLKRNERAPDIVVVDLSCRPFKPVWFMEIEKSSRIGRLQKKCEETLLRYSISECLILDYEKNIWYRKLDSNTFNRPNPKASYSNFLKLDLSKAVRWEFYYPE